MKRIYRTKRHPDSSVNYYIASLFLNGYTHVAVLDYGDTFAPIARHDTSCYLLSQLSQIGSCIIYVKSAFLNGLLREEIYVDQPEDFQVARMED